MELLQKLDRQILDESGNFIPNLQRHTWMLNDQNLAIASYSTISLSLSPYILNLDSYTNIWKTIERQLQSTNQSRILQLNNELQDHDSIPFGNQRQM